MDPRHPEQAISRIDELIEQYKKLLSDMRVCDVSSRIAQMERECGLVVQEICLVAPRLHEAMMQVSRTRRAALARGIVLGYPEDTKNTVSHEVYTAPNQAEVEIAEIKPKKKRGRKPKKNGSGDNKQES